MMASATDELIVYIYHLLDESDQVRYVGQAIDPQKRFRGHLAGHSGPHTRRWVRKMLAAGLAPRMVVVSEHPQAEVTRAEADEIDKQVAAGCRLTNIQSGPLVSPRAARAADATSRLARRREVDPFTRALIVAKARKTREQRKAAGICNPPRPASLQRAVGLRDDVIRKVWKSLPPQTGCDGSPADDYLTVAFVRRNEAVLRGWLERVDRRKVKKPKAKTGVVRLAALSPSARRALRVLRK